MIARSDPPLGLSLVIPAWNEEQRLSETLAKYVPALEESHRPFEVIVVADGVTDRTPDVADRYSSRGVKLLRFDSKLGKGGAVLAGLKATRHPSVGFVDADGPIPTKDLFALVNTLDSADCAIASRAMSGSVSRVRRSPGRRFLSRLWNLAVRGTLLLPVRDTQCGAKFFRASSVSCVLPKVAVTNWAFDASLLFHLHEAGLTIREVPVEWTESTGSKLVITRDVPRMLLSLVGIRLMNSKVGRYVTRSPSSVAAHSGGFD